MYYRIIAILQCFYEHAFRIVNDCMAIFYGLQTNVAISLKSFLDIAGTIASSAG